MFLKWTPEAIWQKLAFVSLMLGKTFSHAYATVSHEKEAKIEYIYG